MRKKLLLIIALALAFVHASGAEPDPNVSFNFLAADEPVSQRDYFDGGGATSLAAEPSADAPILRDGGSSLVGDVNQDGKLSIADVTALIEMLMGGDSSDMAGDVNQDGMVSIGDVTALIDLILHAPQSILYSTILVTTTDGSTSECLIDEHTRLRIMKPNLVIETNGMVMTYDLANMAQLCYGQRTVPIDEPRNLSMPSAGTVYLSGLKENALTKVTAADGRVVMSRRGDAAQVQLDNEPSGEYVIQADSQTIKIVKP